MNKIKLLIRLKPFIEASKEFCRIAILAMIPVLIDGLQKDMIDWRLIGLSGIIAFFKAIDKYLHRCGKELDGRTSKSQLLKKGLVRF